MNITSIRSLEGSASARPESEPEGRGIGFEGLLRSEIGVSPSREARSEAGASQRSRTARSSPAETAGAREVDESDAAETMAAGSDAVEDAGARSERAPGEELVPFESGERISDSPAPGEAAEAGLDEVEAAISTSHPSAAGDAAAQTSPPADAAATAATSGSGSESAATIASTAVGQAASARSRSDAGDSGAAGSPGSADGIARAGVGAGSARAVADGVAAGSHGRSVGSASTAVDAVAASPTQGAAADTTARAGSPGSAPADGESDRARTGRGTGMETLEARIAGRAAPLAGSEAARAASTGSSRLEGTPPAIDSRAPGVAARAEGRSDSDRSGAQDREGGDRHSASDRSVDPRLADRGSADGLAARAGFDSAIGVGSVLPATAQIDGSTGAATSVSALPVASVGATLQPGVDAPPAGAAPPAPAADALAVQTEWLATRGGGSARLVLHPPELGEIAIRVRVRDGSVDVVMIAHEAAAKAIAEEQSDRLAQAFSTRDLRMGSFEVRQAETRAAAEAGPEAQLGNPDARDGGQSRRESNAAAADRVDRGGGAPRSLNGRPAGLPAQALAVQAERSVDLRI